MNDEQRIEEAANENVKSSFSRFESFIAGAKYERDYIEKQAKLSIEEIDVLKSIGVTAENWYAVRYDSTQEPTAIFRIEAHAIAYRNQFTSTSIVEPWPMVIRDYRKGGITRKQDSNGK